MDKKNLRHLPWLVWLIIISILSFIPGDKLPALKLEWVSIDKLAHFSMYFVLSTFFYFGFFKTKMNLNAIKMYLVLILVGIVFGIFVELIQGNFIYQRYFDISDIVANTIGTIFGMITVILIGRKFI